MGEVSGPATGGWPALRWLALRWLRRRWVAMIPLALIVAVGTAGTVLSLASAQRTEGAYRAYLERANVSDVVINPSTNTREIEQAIRTLPGVEQVTSDSLLLVTNDDGAPRPRTEIGEAGEAAVVRGSPDGRYDVMDRPVVREGRLPTGRNEAAVTVELAEEGGFAVGDVESLAFWRAVPDLAEGEHFERLNNEVVSPIGVEQVTIVGIVVLGHEILPDELFPRQTALVSPDLAARYTCVPSTPPAQSSFEVAVATLFPVDCAAEYRYYSLSLADGAGGVQPAVAEIFRRSDALNEQLGDSIDMEDADLQSPPAYYPVISEIEPELRRVERAVRPTVTALTVLGTATAAAMLGLAGLAVARELRRTASTQDQWRQLGLGSMARMFVLSVPPAAAAVLGVVVGVAVTAVVRIRPLGVSRVLDPAGQRLSGLALLVTASLLVLTVTVVVVLAWRAGRRSGSPESDVGAWPMHRAATRLASPATVSGLRAAYGQRSAIPVVVGGIVLTASFVAAMLFGASLSNLVSTPRSYGWTWDIAATTGGGYGDLDVDEASRALDDDPDVEAWTALGFVNGTTLDGEPTMGVVALDRTSDVEFPVLEGALPRADDEVALGSSTASELGLDFGDRVELAGQVEPTAVTITGIVVFPTLGPLFSERVGPGTGMLIPEALVPPEILLDVNESPLTFVGVDLRDGADSPTTRARVAEKLEGLDVLGFPVIPYSAPVRPPEIVDARSTLSVPVAVGVVLASVAAVGLLFASWASARARRRELAVLRALGFSNAQVRRSVRVQSVATMVAALAIGVPVGAIAGRVLWRSFARQLGVVPDPASPWLSVALVVLAGIALAVVAAQLPAHLAARATPAEALRSE